MKLWCRLFFILFVINAAPAIAGETIKAWINSVELELTVARESNERRQGLMGRKSLNQNEGMLLVYPEEQIIRLWMLNTHMPLDVGFFDSDMVLISVVSMQPDGGREIHSSPKPALYAMEMNQGWFANNGIRPGAMLRLPFKVESK